MNGKRNEYKQSIWQHLTNYKKTVLASNRAEYPNGDGVQLEGELRYRVFTGSDWSPSPHRVPWMRSSNFDASTF